MTFQEFKDALEVLNVNAHIAMVGDQCVVRLERVAIDRTTVIATHADLERAIEIAVARFIEIRRKNPTAQTIVEYETVNHDLTNPWAKT